MKRRRARKDRREGARAQARPAAGDARAGDARAHDAHWLAALLLIAVLVAYLPALGGGFVWDDDAHVTRPELRSLLGLWRIWTEVGATQQYYPLLHSAFWVEHRLWGNASLGYHLVNVLLHATSAWLLFLVLRRLGAPGVSLAAGLFLLHPVHVESVAWITEQKNTLSLALYLGAALAYLGYDASRRRSSYCAATALFVAGLLTKTIVATLPGALLVVLWWRRGRLSWREDVRPLGPWFLLGAGAGIATALFEARLIGASGEDFALSPLERGMLAGRVVWFYLAKLVAPVNLTFIYPRFEIDARDAAQYLYPLAAAAVLAGGFWLRRRSRAPLAVALFFGGSLLPVLGFLNVYPFVFSFVADHFQYVASLGPLSGAAAGAALVAGRLGATGKRVVQAGSLAVLALLGTLTFRQCESYKDARTLYQTTLARNPDCYLCLNNLAADSLQDGRLDEATARYREVLRLKPRSAEALSNLGNLLAQSGDVGAAIDHYRRSLEVAPNNVITRTNLGIVLFNSGRVPEAKAEFEQALRVMPDYEPARKNLATIRALETKTSPGPP